MLLGSGNDIGKGEGCREFQNGAPGTKMSTTVYHNHWAEARNVTVNDATGGIKNTAGSGASFDASARVEQMFDGAFDLVCEFTINTANAMAFGVYSQLTSYAPGAVTVASLLAGWEINGGDGLVKESGNTRATQVGVGVGDQFKITLTAAGALTYHYKAAGAAYALVFTSAITAATVKAWRPWRVVATFSAANAELTPCTITGESAEHYDPDVPANIVVLQEPMVFEVELGQIEPGACPARPYARAFMF